MREQKHTKKAMVEEEVTYERNHSQSLKGEEKIGVQEEDPITLQIHISAKRYYF